MPKVLITPEVLVNTQGPHTKILEQAGFQIAFPKNPQFARGECDQGETVDELSGFDAVVAGSEHLSAGVIKALPQLRVIARNGVGYDRVDISAATENNIVVTITPTANHAAVAEHALALLLAVSKNIVVGDRATRAGQWPRELIEPIRGKTIGILGLGRIGRSMATRSIALGMSVIAHDKFADKEFARQHGIEMVDLSTLASRCDVLSIHCPITEATRGMIDRQFFAAMKATAIVINTARGGIINEADLIVALQDGQIKAAGLDVFGPEPPAKDNPLFALENVVLTPHAAGGETLAMADMAIESATCVAKLYRGEWPSDAIVNRQVQDGWTW